MFLLGDEQEPLKGDVGSGTLPCLQDQIGSKKPVMGVIYMTSGQKLRQFWISARS